MKENKKKRKDNYNSSSNKKKKIEKTDDDDDVESEDVYKTLVGSLKVKKSVVADLIHKIVNEQDGLEDEDILSEEENQSPMATKAAGWGDEKLTAESDIDDSDISLDGDNDNVIDDDSDDNRALVDCNSTVQDNFRVHFENEISEDLLVDVKEQKNLKKETFACGCLGLVQHVSYKNNLHGDRTLSVSGENLRQSHVKQRILGNLKPENASFTELQTTLFSHLNQYKDVFFSQRTFSNAEEIRKIYCLHALNHVLKTRSKILKNNAKLADSVDNDTIEDVHRLRDQGLTRPKVIILTPFREGAKRIVESLLSLALGNDVKGEVMKKKRFITEFKEDTEERQSSAAFRPEDFKAMFAGNIDDCFRIGLTVMRKAVKLYADFYSADIIVASPLGLRLIIGAEGDKERDIDFLSSIEMMIVDQADVFHMQNWQHVTHIFDHLHIQPKQSHGVDFSRVRMWTLNGWAKYYRQSIVISSFITPELNSLFSKHCNNFAGSIKCRPSSVFGTVKQISVQVPQVFHRITCNSYDATLETRFNYFKDKVLPKYRGALYKQTALFVSSYFDFVRLRNYFKQNQISFALINEYSERSNISKARSQFYQKQKDFLIFTERFYFFYRYKLRGIRHLVFYDLPNYAHFYAEIMNSVDSIHHEDAANATCTVLYTKYDALRLENVVGTSRCHSMLTSARETHMICTAK